MEKKYSIRKFPFNFGLYTILPNSSIAFQTYDQAKDIQFLNQINLGADMGSISSLPLGPSKEGFYGTDGSIILADSSRLLYIYRYKNVVLTLDSNLSVISTFNT